MKLDEDRTAQTPRWGMVIDLTQCNGCTCCSINCSQSNGLPVGSAWREVPSADVSSEEMPQRAFLSMACMHCENPPCMDVCPSGATYQRPDGIVDIHTRLCLGCGYCVVACPYLARTLTTRQQIRDAAVLGLGPERGASDRVAVGVCTKCDFCLPRIDAGLASGLTPGLDVEATPTCVNTCLSNALHFGDLNDPSSNVSKILKTRDVARVHEELGTKPAVYYVTG